MKRLSVIKALIVLIAISACNENSKYNASQVSFGGMKPHDRLALTELESNFDSPNDFILISHYGKDMDFDSDYEEGDSLITYYQYHLTNSKNKQVATVLTFDDKAEIICAPCGKEEIADYKEVYGKTTTKNIDKTIDALDSIGLREK